MLSIVHYSDGASAIGLLLLHGPKFPFCPQISPLDATFWGYFWFSANNFNRVLKARLFLTLYLDPFQPSIFSALSSQSLPLNSHLSLPSPAKSGHFPSCSKCAPLVLHFPAMVLSTILRPPFSVLHHFWYRCALLFSYFKPKPVRLKLIWFLHFCFVNIYYELWICHEFWVFFFLSIYII